MPRKRQLQVVFAAEELNQARADQEANRSLSLPTTSDLTPAQRMGVSEEEFAQILSSWKVAVDGWEPQRPGEPSRDFLERLDAYLAPRGRGRPRGPDPETLEIALREWKLYLKDRTCKQIALELYPDHADDMEPQIRKRISRLKKRLGRECPTTIPV
jgi:hypothetical protein